MPEENLLSQLKKIAEQGEDPVDFRLAKMGMVLADAACRGASKSKDETITLGIAEDTGEIDWQDKPVSEFNVCVRTFFEEHGKPLLLGRYIKAQGVEIGVDGDTIVVSKAKED